LIMEDYLVNHALKNVWCTPDQDNQVIIKPSRITPINGAWGEPLVRFHLFQVGQLHPLLLNLFTREGEWVSFAEAMVDGKNICDIYTTLGVQLPRTQTWYMLTPGMNVLIAVKKNLKLPYDFNDVNIYLRSYSNEYFASGRSQQLTDYVAVEGGTMHTAIDILSLQTKYGQYTTLPGGVYAFVNGYKVPAISMVTTKVGDVAEFVYDSAIVRVLDFKLDQLTTFDSTLDTKGKYVLHYAGSDDLTIDFFDDIDIFLVDPVTQRGVYVHKNAADTLRMLSHRDYSIPVAYLAAYLVHFKNAQGVIDFKNLYLRLHVRKSGYQRSLVLESHRINELYKLPDVDLTAALLGIESNVPTWRADALESSAYVQLMDSKFTEVTAALVKKAYGYSAIAKLVGDTPSTGKVLGTSRVITVPYLLSSNATAFEYDAQGLLLEWHHHTTGVSYVCHNPATACVEMIAGEGSHRLDEAREQTVVSLDDQADYRFYVAELAPGPVEHNWVDATGSNWYTQTPTEARWSTTSAQYPMVRSDKKFLLYQELFTVTEGLILLSLTSLQDRSGVEVLRELDVPLGELDVFLNGHSLIEGLDYVMKFPFITIVNKKYLIDPLRIAQTVVIRFTGFCDTQLTPTVKNEFGFIQNGKISVNQRFDIHDGKVLRIVCGGGLKHRDEMVFSEEEKTYNFMDASNGQPYLIRDIVVPMWGLTDTDTYEYRAESLATDKSISDYMSLKVPEAPVAGLNPLLERYAVYSPFLCKLLYDLVSGALPDDEVKGHYDDELVRMMCAPYEYLLAYDPIHIDQAHYPDYVEIHPHLLTTVMSLDLPRYRFISKVVRMYANDRINLSSFIQMV
jgi:hypothetical protein